MGGLLFPGLPPPIESGAMRCSSSSTFSFRTFMRHLLHASSRRAEPTARRLVGGRTPRATGPLPPRPELHAHEAAEPVRDEVERTTLAAVDTREARHLRLERAIAV